MVYLDEPIYPVVPSVSARPPSGGISLEPYDPQYSKVLIKQSEVAMTTLALNLGDKYRESYCTPRTITINLSEELEANNDRFYMVMVLRAEGKDVDQYR